jgi:hypothetical protein
MSTQSWTTRVRHDSDATFREWGSELSAKLAAVGLVQTSDTGQVNWTTVTRPGTNTSGGYEIWRWNDSLQGTAPIYMRVDYGTGSGTTAPRIQITVGTGSNGSGTISGTALSSARTIGSGTGAETGDLTRQSWLTHSDGILGLAWKSGANSYATFILCRTCDNTGAPTATGAIARWSGGSTSTIGATQAFRYASTAAAYTAQTAIANAAMCLNPQVLTSSAVGADNQAYLCFTVTPRAEPLVGICGYVSGEVTEGNTFTATMVGSTPRTYIAFSTSAGPLGPVAGAGGLFPAVIWE